MDEITRLEQEVIAHKQRYYRGEATISDAEYDALEEQLRALAPDSYALQLVGSEVGAQKVAHQFPMLSLDKRRSVAEVVSWMAGERCLVSDKMDGSSCSLVYKKGIFFLGKTRGDGTFGENLTIHLAHVRFPRLLRDKRWQGRDVEVRGELCIHDEAFMRLGDELVARGGERPSSIRNIVAGLLHRKEDLDLCRFLDFFAYEVMGAVAGLSSEQEKFALLQSEGFLVPGLYEAHDDESFVAAMEQYQQRGEKSGYLTDGLVIAVDNLAAQRARGTTAHHPKGKLAFKFASDTQVTHVRDILVDVGRTGKLTFVGVVDPVVLSGATVSRVTLNNVKYIESNNINVGCEIEITRSGEVIPKHVRTIKPAGRYRFPQNCPVCETRLESSDTGVDLRCPNGRCPQRIKGRLANWIQVVGIEGIGPALLDRFYELGLVQSIGDLYRLRPEQISSMEGLGEKSAKNLVDAIQGASTISLVMFLSALGIDGLGPGVAKLLVEALPRVAELRRADAAVLEQIEGIGPVLAQNTVVGLSQVGWPLLEELAALGVTVVDGEVRSTDGVLTGKNVAITGTLSRPRKEIKKRIEQAGGKVVGAVSGATSYLVCNEPSGSSKYRKAVTLGVPVIDETELEALLKTSFAKIDLFS